MSALDDYQQIAHEIDTIAVRLRDELALVKAENERLKHAARLLAKSLTDEMIESVRYGWWGFTNAAVLRHWRTEVLAILEQGVTD